MAKYNYRALREDVDRWSAQDADAFERWRYDQHAAGPACYDESDLETFGDTAAGFLSPPLRHELLELIRDAEQAERAGNAGRAEALVAELGRALQGAPFASPVPTASHYDSGFDPDPPAIPDISLLDGESPDYDGLLAAVERWHDAETAAIDRGEAERLHAHGGALAHDYAAMIGDNAGIRFREVHSQADDFRVRIRRARDCDRRGDSAQAAVLLEGLRRDLGIRDDATTQIEAYLSAAHRRPRTELGWPALLAALLALTALVSFLSLALS